MTGPLIECGTGWVKVHYRRDVTDADKAAIAAAVAGSADENAPDCYTKREHELYQALMQLASAVQARFQWKSWKQGGAKVAPNVYRALRLPE